ncbi:MAG: hypothetical protein ACI3V3_09005 [Faecousia sp.]
MFDLPQDDGHFHTPSVENGRFRIAMDGLLHSGSWFPDGKDICRCTKCGAWITPPRKYYGALYIMYYLLGPMLVVGATILEHYYPKISPIFGGMIIAFPWLLFRFLFFRTTAGLYSWDIVRAPNGIDAAIAEIDEEIHDKTKGVCIRSVILFLVSWLLLPAILKKIFGW